MAERSVVVGLPADPAERFQELFQRHYRAVLRYAVRRVGPDEADDVAEDVFTVAWRRIGEAPPEPETLWWLYGIARRVTANHLRSARRRVRLVVRLSGGAPVASPELPDPVLAAALAFLSQRDQEVLRLIAWEDLEPREIATVLGCTPGSAAVRAHRARRRLAAELGRQGWER